MASNPGTRSFLDFLQNSPLGRLGDKMPTPGAAPPGGAAPAPRTPFSPPDLRNPGSWGGGAPGGGNPFAAPAGGGFAGGGGGGGGWGTSPTTGTPYPAPWAGGPDTGGWGGGAAFGYSGNHISGQMGQPGMTAGWGGPGGINWRNDLEAAKPDYYLWENGGRVSPYAWNWALEEGLVQGTPGGVGQQGDGRWLTGDARNPWGGYAGMVGTGQEHGQTPWRLGTSKDNPANIHPALKSEIDRWMAETGGSFQDWWAVAQPNMGGFFTPGFLQNQLGYGDATPPPPSGPGAAPGRAPGGGGVPAAYDPANRGVGGFGGGQGGVKNPGVGRNNRQNVRRAEQRRADNAGGGGKGSDDRAYRRPPAGGGGKGGGKNTGGGGRRRK